MELLVASDLSHPPAPALEVAVDVADHFDASLKLVHAPYPIPFEVPEVGMTRRVSSSARETVEADLRRRVRELELQREPEAVVVPTKRPHEAVLREAAKRPSALIVVGSEQRTGWRRFIARPSVAMQVLDRATRPVLVVPDEGATKLRSGARVLAAVDLGAGSARVLDTAAAWARSLGGSLDVIHVSGVAVGAFGMPRPGYWIMRSARHAKRWLAEATAHIAGSDLEITTCVRPAFSPGRAVLQRANRRGADLIVVGARRRGTLVRRWLGSPTSTILRRSNVPVLGIPVPSGPEREASFHEDTY